MLIEKYLSVYHFNEFHSIELSEYVDNAYEKMLNCDFSNATLIKILFRLRGMPKDFYSIRQLTNMGFIKLDEEPGKEILFGMMTTNPMFNTCRSNLTPSDFIHQSDPRVIKAVINFCVSDKNGLKHSISTETRVWCGGEKIKAKFKWYWFFIKPFSQIIRKAMLKQIRKHILDGAKVGTKKVSI